MRTPLIRQGAGQNDLHRIHEEHQKQRREIDKMLATAALDESQQEKRRRGIVSMRSAPGNEHRLRGIPVAMRGISGAVPGSVPHNIR